MRRDGSRKPRDFRHYKSDRLRHTMEGWRNHPGWHLRDQGPLPRATLGAPLR